MSISIAICDNDKSVCNEIHNYIERFFSYNEHKYNVFLFNKPDELIQALDNNTSINILFLDTFLPYNDGIKTGQLIREKYSNLMNIVYMSSESEYSMSIFSSHPFDFLIKPLDYKRVQYVLYQLMELYNESNRLFTYSSNKKVYNILYNDIIYFESDLRHINIYMQSGEVLHYNGRLSEEKDNLPDYFIPISHSYIINSKHIAKRMPNSLLMKGNKELKISRNYKTTVDQLLSDYMHMK